MTEGSLEARLEAARHLVSELQQQPDHSQTFAIETLAELSITLADLQTATAQLHAREQTLRTSEYTYRSIIENSDDGIVVVDEQGIVVEWNRRQAEITGLSQAAALGRYLWDIMFDLAAPARRAEWPGESYIEYIQHVLQTGQSPDQQTFRQITIARPDGEQRVVQLLQTTVPTGHGFFLVDTVRDVTERLRMERQLHDSEARYRMLFEQANDAIFLENEQDEIIDVNQRACELMGYSRAELLKMTVPALLPPERRQFAGPVVRTQIAQSGQAPFESVNLHRDGYRIPVEISLSHMTDSDEGLILTIVRDITDRKRAEQALRESEQRYRALVETSPDAIVLLDRAGHILLCNRQMAAICGYAVEDLQQTSLFDLIPQDERALARANFARLQQLGALHNVEHHINCADGRWAPIELSASVVYEPEQQPAAVVAVLRDITQRKEADVVLQQRNAELATLNTELQARNDDLDAFAHTVAHDLKNPLHLLIGFAESLKPSFGSISDDQREEALQYLVRSGHKMNNIIDELLLLAEVHKAQFELNPLDMSRILWDVQQRLIDSIHDRQASIVLPATWPLLLGYAPWVEEVWVNYLSNALKYGGKPPLITLGAEVQANGLARLWIRDNGDGILPEVQSHLFTPFMRLENVRARGHGLGLSIVRRIVEKMGGQVGIVSTGQAGQGCEFYFTLPLADNEIS